MIDLKSGKNEPTAMIPTGWYPTSVVVSPDGKRLFVATAKGARVHNPNNGTGTKGANRVQYIENIIDGTVAMIATPSDAEMGPMTQAATRLNLAPDNRKLPSTGIKHVIYIIKENRTYDEILGDLPQGNGDKSLTLFGRERDAQPTRLSRAFRPARQFLLLGGSVRRRLELDHVRHGQASTTSGMCPSTTADAGATTILRAKSTALRLTC